MGRDASTHESSLPRVPALAWSSSGAALGAVYAIPAALTALHDVPKGAAFAVGVVPAAIVGLAPTRRGRRAVAVIGVLVGTSIFVGSLLANVPLLAVLGIFALSVGAVAIARRGTRAGPLLVTLGLPLVGVGFSYTDLDTAGGLALIMIAGSAYAWLVSMLWNELPVDSRARGAAPPLSMEYGFRLGLTGATAAAIGFALDLDHVGWACAAALLVMRPSAEMQELRSVGRLASVVVGALASIAVVRAAPPAAVYSVVFIAVIACAAATRGSRWYVTPMFTTFLVFVLLLYSDAHTAASRFGERVGETLLGVGLAYLFGVAWPAVAHRAHRATRTVGG